MTGKRSIAIMVAQRLAKYSKMKSRRPRNGKIIVPDLQGLDARYGITHEEMEKLLAEAREVGDAKYERLQRLRKHSTNPKVNIVPATIEKFAKRARKL